MSIGPRTYQLTSKTNDGGNSESLIIIFIISDKWLICKEVIFLEY